MVRGTPKVTAQVRKFVGYGIWVRLNRAVILLRLFPSYNTITHTHIFIYMCMCVDLPGGSAVKYLLPMQKMQVWFLIWEDPLEKEMETHSWELPCSEVHGVTKSQTWISDRAWCTCMYVYIYSQLSRMQSHSLWVWGWWWKHWGFEETNDGEIHGAVWLIIFREAPYLRRRGLGGRELAYPIWSFTRWV